MRGLVLLLVEKDLATQREIYLGNLQWSMLNALHKLGGQQITVKSYGEIYELQYADMFPKQSKEEIAAEYDEKVNNMLDKYQRRRRP